MSFGLNNASATYQRLVNKIFKHQIRRNIKVYVDDILVKSRKDIDHVQNLQKNIRYTQIVPNKVEHSKCIFGLGSERFLQFMVTNRGTKGNPEKIQAITSMKELETLHDIQNLIDVLRHLVSFSLEVQKDLSHLSNYLMGLPWQSEGSSRNK